MPVTIRKYIREYGIVTLPEYHPLLQPMKQELKDEYIKLGCVIGFAYFCTGVITGSILSITATLLLIGC